MEKEIIMTGLWLSLRIWIGTLLVFATGAFLIALFKDPAIEVIGVLFLLQTVVHIAASVVSLTCTFQALLSNKDSTPFEKIWSTPYPFAESYFIFEILPGSAKYRLICSGNITAIENNNNKSQHLKA